MPKGFQKLAEGVGKAVETVPALYDDGLKTTTQETGKTLALLPRTINAALAPLRQWIAQREYNVAETEKLLAQKLESVSAPKIVTPPSYVAVPAIQAISYSMDSNELRNLYANLLAKAMYTETHDHVHPSFVETIKQLSPEEARFFKHLCSLKTRPMLDVNLIRPDASFYTISSQVNRFSKGYTDHLSLSLDNLSRLGLINIPSDFWYGEDALYEPLIEAAKIMYPFEKYKQKYPDAERIDYHKSRVDITSYGKSFYNTCVCDFVSQGLT